MQRNDWQQADHQANSSRGDSCQQGWSLLVLIFSSIEDIFNCDLKVMVAEAIDITRETYFCIAMDRDSNGPVIVARQDPDLS